MATSTPTSRSTPTTTGCCGSHPLRSSASWRWRTNWAASSRAEHGIGITKFEFLEDREDSRLRRLQTEGRSERAFQARGKLMPGADIRNAYTPSFNLLGTESLILEQSEVGAISASIKDCLRCGKCKPVCARRTCRARTCSIARATRSLATSLLIEAFSGEEQTRRGVARTSTSSTMWRTIARCATVSETVPGRHRLRRRLRGDAGTSCVVRTRRRVWARRPR